MDAVIFDFDGLILDTEWPAYVTVAEAFESHGLPFTIEQWQHRIGRGDNGPWTELLADHVDGIDHDEIDARRRRRKNALTDAQPVQPGVADLLDAADGADLRKGVASSSPLSWVGRHLGRLELDHRFHAVRTCDDVERTKPWPDVFLAAAEALGVVAGRAIVFEDSVHGVTAAKEAGMFCVAVPNRITAGGDFSDADLVLDSLLDFDLVAFLGS